MAREEIALQTAFTIRVMRRILCFALFTLCMPATRADIAHTRGSFLSGGTPISYELYESSGPSAGVVVLVHGADGLQDAGWRERYEQQANALAKSGFTVLFPHYFERTGSKGVDTGEILKHFADWARTIADAVGEAGKRKGANPLRIGLVGVSLGASLANTESTQDPRVAAVVEYFGTLPDWVPSAAKRWAPTLVLHGDADVLVPVKAAADLEAVLKAHDVDYEAKIYPGQGHGFTGDALHDSESRAAAFLKKHLATSAVVDPSSAPPVPAKYQAIYKELEGYLQEWHRQLDSGSKGNLRATTFSAELLAANMNRGEDLLKPDAVAGALGYADALRSLGITGVTVSVGFPVLTPQYPKFAEYLRFYKALMKGLRERGMTVMVEDGFIMGNPAFTSMKVDYATMTIEEYTQLEIAVGKVVVEELKPDYLQIANEPDVPGVVINPRLWALNSPKTFARVAREIAAPLLGHGVLIGGGQGDWNDPEFMRELVASVPFDFFDLHFYRGFNAAAAMKILDIAATSGKPLTISECWIEKTSPAFDRGVPFTLDGYAGITRRNGFAFWAPLDRQFIEGLLKLSAQRKLAFVSPFWSKYLFGYVPYSDAVERQSPAETLREADAATLRALTQGRVTPAGAALREALKQK